MDRGNSDIVVLSLVTIAALVSIAHVRVVPGCILATAGFLKIFAFGSGAMLLGMRRFRWSTITVFFLGTGLALLVQRDELAVISARTPRSDWMSFGVSTIPIRLQSFVPVLEGNGRAIGIAALGTFILGILAVLSLGRLQVVERNFSELSWGIANGEVASVLFLGGSGAVLLAYLVGSSYDYRLIFCLLAISGLLSVPGAASRGATAGAALLALLMWCSSGWLTLGSAADWLWLLVAPAWTVLAVSVAWTLVRGAPSSTALPAARS